MITYLLIVQVFSGALTLVAATIYGLLRLSGATLAEVLEYVPRERQPAPSVPSEVVLVEATQPPAFQFVPYNPAEYDELAKLLPNSVPPGRRHLHSMVD